MSEINKYGRQLNPEEIEAGVHRTVVGGVWGEIGRLQFEFLRARGLQPAHRLLDLGGDALHGGIHAIDHLEPGNHYGLDSNRSLLEAAWRELAIAGLEDKNPHFALTDRFELGLLEQQFDYALALSVFTHLFTNHIVRCLAEVRKVLTPEGQFFATLSSRRGACTLARIVGDGIQSRSVSLFGGNDQRDGTARWAAGGIDRRMESSSCAADEVFSIPRV